MNAGKKKRDRRELVKRKGRTTEELQGKGSLFSGRESIKASRVEFSLGSLGQGE